MNALPDWSKMSKEQRVDALAPLVSQGYSAGAIATKFANASRNAIISQCLRCGLKLARGQKAISRQTAPVSATPALVSEVARPVAQTKTDRAKVEPRGAQSRPRLIEPGHAPLGQISWSAAFEPLAGVAPVHLSDLDARQCHWPVNGLDGIEPIFCGASASDLYCTSHARLAYLPRGHRGAM